MRDFFKALAISAMLIVLLSLAGCGAAWFSASTTACYKTKDGAEICYTSSKNQENFHAKVAVNPDGTLKDLDIQTTATTAESAIAAASASLAAMADAITKLIPLVEKAAAMGAGS